MTTNTQLYNFAKQFKGKGGATFRRFAGLGSGQPYCAAYVSYIFNKGGAKNLFYGGRVVTYCPTAIKWCEANLAQVPLYLAMPMDIIFFDWQPNGRPDHIGFVKAKKSTSEIYTHEGNTSGGIVAEKTRPARYVEGIFRPHFSASFKIAPLVIDKDFGYNSIAMLQKALGLKPTGILDKTTVRALQKKAGATQDGAWGKKTSRAVQKLVGLTGKAIDGDFGPTSTAALQKWINNQNKKSSPSVTTTKKVENKPVQPVSAPKGYTGQFPDLVAHSGQKIAYLAKDLAYPKGTAKKKYTYGKGHATLAFQKALNKVFPHRTSWGPEPRAGASCDVASGTVVRFSGVDPKFPRGLQEQIPHMQKSAIWKKTGINKASEMKAGDVGVYINKGKGAHIWLSIGDKLHAEGSFTYGYFLHISKRKYTNSSKKKVWGIYRANIPTPISEGDRGTEVIKLQKFLNWFGNYGLAVDGINGPKTALAVAAFQKKVGITVDRVFGSASLAKAKAYKKFSPSKSVAPATHKVSKVVDVSYWQHTIDWKKASKEIDGAILRCSYTSQKSFTLSEDSTFLPNINGASQYGLKVGAYHYSQAISIDEARKEAEYICKKLSGYKNRISLPVVIDWEFGGRLNAKKAKSLGKAKCTDIISAFCEVVIRHGFTPMVYANYNTFSNYLDYPKLKKKYKIWLAQYSSKAGLAYDYWQYTSSGKVSGINGNVDINKAVI